LNILVTGAAGFIGYAISRKLLEAGHTVIGVDNFGDYYPPVLKEGRHEQLKKYDQYTGYRHDLVDYEFLTETVKKHKTDLICHLAAQAGVRHSLKKPFDYQKSNLEAFLNLLEVCRHQGIERFVYASSSSVYGGNEKLPFSETDNVNRPISLYAATKCANELMAHSYSHLYGFSTVGLRFFTVYGPWGRPDMATWLFTEAISRGETIKVFNGGKMKRDFTYVDDITNGINGALFSEKLDKYEVINLGNNRCENLMDMIQCIASEVGTEANMDMQPMQPGDVPATYADVSLAKDKLGFEPSTPMQEGLAKFVAWYKENPKVTEAVYQAKKAKQS